jgi:hypothetical protein
MNETPRIPSPIPYLMQVPDLRAHNTTYDWRMLFMLVLMSLGSKRTNILAIAQWMEDQRDSGTGCWPWGHISLVDFRYGGDPQRRAFPA